MDTTNSSENLSNETNSAPPKTWLVESILVTLFCCLPFGIVGIINASKVESKFYAGQIEEAKRSSREAGKWTKIGFWIGISGIILYILFVVVVGGIGFLSEGY